MAEPEQQGVPRCSSSEQTQLLLQPLLVQLAGVTDLKVLSNKCLSKRQ
jgi:hypothetical protein